MAIRMITTPNRVGAKAGGQKEAQRTLELIGNLLADEGKLRSRYQTRCEDLQHLMRKLQERLGLTETRIPQAEGASL